MSILPKSLENTIAALQALPGVGRRSAERYGYYLLRTNPTKASQIAETLSKLHSGVTYCPKTFALIDSSEDISSLYSDPRRDRSIVAIVENPFDIAAIENTGQFQGTYHVLGGLLSPLDGVTPEMLHIPELLQRIADDKVKEIILAISASVEGESTASFIAHELSTTDCTISRLARGLPIGLDIEYADQLTLTRAFEGRTML